MPEISKGFPSEIFSIETTTFLIPLLSGCISSVGDGLGSLPQNLWSIFMVSRSTGGMSPSKLTVPVILPPSVTMISLYFFSTASEEVVNIKVKHKKVIISNI